MAQSCVVSKSKYDKQMALMQKLSAQKDDCLKSLEIAELAMDTMELKLANKLNYIEFLRTDSSSKEQRIAKLEQLNKQLQTLYDELDKEKEDIDQFANKQKEQYSKSLQAREKALIDLKKSLLALQMKLQNQEEQNNLASAKIMENTARINELEQMLHAHDSILNGIKNVFLKSLSGYGDSVLTVVNKNGKLYVTISDKLLFKSGSTAIDPLGREALIKIAKTLEKNTDFFIYVEGHTDSIPFVEKSGFIKDNWDLSVLRATNVLKVLTENAKIDQSKLIPCGRADALPIADNKFPLLRSKNRRTEIILTPDYAKILELLNH